MNDVENIRGKTSFMMPGGPTFMNIQSSESPLSKFDCYFKLKKLIEHQKNQANECKSSDDQFGLFKVSLKPD